MNSITITIPIPDKRLSQNARVHWRVLDKVKKPARAAAKMYALAALGSRTPPKWTSVEVSIAYFWPNARNRDRDNARARLKVAMDGFTDAGIWVDDSAIVSDPMTMQIDRKNPRVEITITSVQSKGGGR